MAERILALDPGGTTGWAMWSSHSLGPPTDSVWDHFTYGQLGPHEHHKELNDLLGEMQTQKFTLICEKFDFRQMDNQRMGTVLISREYIGVAKLFAAERMNSPVVLQSPSTAKGFIPDKAKDGLAANEKLKVLGLYVPGKPHAMDAMRHLLYYMVNKRKRYDLIKPWQNL